MCYSKKQKKIFFSLSYLIRVPGILSIRIISFINLINTNIFNDFIFVTMHTKILKTLPLKDVTVRKDKQINYNTLWKVAVE